MWHNKPKRSLAKGLFLALAFVLTAVAFTGCVKNNGNAADTSEAVATYKDGQVTKLEFDKFKSIIKFSNPMYGSMLDEPSIQQSLLDQLIAFKILEERADADVRKEAAAKTEEQMKQVNDYFEQQTGSKEGFDNTLKGLDLTRDDIAQYIKRSIIVTDTFGKKVTDDQVKAEYDLKLKDNPHLYDTATVSHILIGLNKPDGSPLRTKDEALVRAKDVKDKLVQGGDFAALAKEYSDDEGSKDNGGKYENAYVNDWVAPFKKAALELPLNQISDPVETEYGYHVMKVDSRNTKSFDEVKPDIRSELAEIQISEFMEKELPDLITSTNLPKPPETPQNGQAPDEGKSGAGTNPGADSGSAPNTPAQTPESPTAEGSK